MDCNFQMFGKAVTTKIMFFFSSRRRHTRLQGDWSSDVCSSDLSLVVSVAEGVDVQAVSPIARLSVATIAAEKSGR